MGVVEWLILGLVAGLIASKITGHQGPEIALDVVLGIVGAFIGGALFHLIGGYGVTRFNPWSLLVAAGGAVLVLLAWNSLPIRRPPLSTR
jgi:uncharacterized membrane protein YeaQ/YmgE (transglycosylase-associated protein family)